MSSFSTITTAYNNIKKNRVYISIIINGQTENVEAYNIEGKSRCELLDKLREADLTNPSDTDVLIEVKDGSYNNANSSQCFEVGSIARPGQKVIIIHYNETTKEWEYIGEQVIPLIAFCTEDDGSVLINEINFHDFTFRMYVSDNFDLDKDGKLMPSEIHAVRVIDVSGSNKNKGTITSLKGIEYFSNLIQLNCSYNKITSIDLSSNAALTDLYCNNNRLTSLVLPNTTVLKNINC
ncbi:MAG: hypothetical protein SO412_10845, partial [Erysipelotrichaceae bacterium]|nr:hypothetical protein [Erysipelotrichaceae bacterium]